MLPIFTSNLQAHHLAGAKNIATVLKYQKRARMTVTNKNPFRKCSRSRARSTSPSGGHRVSILPCSCSQDTTISSPSMCPKTRILTALLIERTRFPCPCLPRCRTLLFSEGLAVQAKPEAGSPWRGPSSLSGGQVALVGLALNLATQAVRPSPFYLMDEVNQ